MADQEATSTKKGAPKSFRLVALALILFAVIAIVVVININSGTGTQFRLSDEYYGKSEMLTGLTKDDYERLLAEK